MEISKLKISEIYPYENNVKEHPREQIEQIKNSILQFGNNDPIAVDENGVIIEGHGRFIALKELGYDEAEVIVLSGLSEVEKDTYRIVHNQLTMNSGFDMERLQEELAKLEGMDLAALGIDESVLDDLENEFEEEERKIIPLSDRFIIPPFSVLDTRQGYWTERKRAWKALGIKSEVGRGNDDDKTKGGLTFAVSSQPPDVYRKKEEYEKKTGQKIKWEEYAELFPEQIRQSGTSIFDPVLAEIMYKWFCIDHGTILDPFAGGSVRGIVAKQCGYEYYGNDLSTRQIEANKENAIEIYGDTNGINWSVGDSCEIDTIITKRNFDLVFTCPPYADLEVYSDNEKDISNMEYADFLRAYKTILEKAINMLADDRFCIVVVGDVREKFGLYRDFISDTKKICINAGAGLYNEFILLDNIGSAAMRAAKQFNGSRKHCKVHQNVLVFYKGNLENINKNFPPLDFSGVEDLVKQEEETEE